MVLHALGEAGVLLVQDLLLLLAHGPAQQVGLAQRVAGQLLRDRHDLFLVDDQAVGLAEDVLERLGQLRVDRRDLLPGVLAVGVVVVRVGAHRAGPVQRADRGDVVELGGRHPAQQVAHRPAVELEHAEGVAAGQQLVGRRVVQRDRLDLQPRLAVELDVLQRVVDDREVAQAEEVHLEQPERLAGAHVELRDDRAVGLAALDRDDVDQRLRRHDHAGRVHAPLPLEALQPARGVDDLLDLGVGLVERAHLGGLGVALVGRVEDAGERDVLAHHRGRHGLGDAVGHRVAGLTEQHPGRVLDRRLGLDRGVGDDLGDPVLAVLLGGVADHLAAPALVEVHVDVGHRDALGVEEPLEDQLVLDRVEVGDARARRPPASRRPSRGRGRTGCRPTWRAG